MLTVPFFNFFSIYIFRQPFLVVADPDMVKDILVKEFPKFHDRKVNLKKIVKAFVLHEPLINNSILLLD